ncbi:MAG: YggS family pyridoxal phosphate-dependent enzyme [Planctomycetia bacterium]|nr:YggS family pyridoxal phosphate-dependent enzyme [Planctomycetia bacterium]
MLIQQVKSRVKGIKDRIARAAAKAGRSSDAVRLIAVSKYAGCTDGFVPALLEAGCFALGEGRPQNLLEKYDYFTLHAAEHQLPSVPIEWHLIGSLQRNKIRKLLPFVVLLHSIDSMKLLEALNRIADEEAEVGHLAGKEKIDMLLEVNIAEEESKHGFDPSALISLIPQMKRFQRIRICGLMGMAALNAPDEKVRKQFALLRELRDQCNDRYPEFPDLKELSMGMSHDFEIAVEEGATYVRIGSSLYPEGI